MSTPVKFSLLVYFSMCTLIKIIRSTRSHAIVFQFLFPAIFIVSVNETRHSFLINKVDAYLIDNECTARIMPTDETAVSQTKWNTYVPEHYETVRENDQQSDLQYERANWPNWN